MEDQAQENPENPEVQNERISNIRSVVKSEDPEAFRELLKELPPEYKRDVIRIVRSLFGFIAPDMIRIMFELEYFPTKLVPSDYDDDCNEFEGFIRNVLEHPVISYGDDDEPNMGYILGSLDVLNEHIEGGLASYSAIYFKLEDFINDEQYTGYPVEHPEIRFNLLNFFMGSGSTPCNEHPPVFLKLVELGIPIPDIAIHEANRTDMVFDGPCDCGDPECVKQYNTIELIACNTIEKLILLGWVDTLKQLYDKSPNIVIAGMTNAEKYLDLYEAQIERWKVEVYEKDVTVLDYFSDIKFAEILAEMRNFIDVVSV